MTRTMRIAVVWSLLTLAGPIASALADPATAALGGPGKGDLHPIPPREGGRISGTNGGAGTWWLGTAGIALALAAVGAISVAARRAQQATGGPGHFEVVAKVHLNPRHTVYLLRAGERVFIIGTGTQGSPALLGEWTEAPAESRNGGGA
jgi:flagellar protein FliO/FliZ